MSENTQDKHEAESLFSRPDIAAEIGFVVIYTANIEIWLLPALARILRNKHEVAHAILTNIDNIGAKLNIVYDIASLRKGVPFCEKLIETKEKTLKAIAFRNSLAHGHFGFSRPASGEMSLVSNVLSQKRGKPKEKLLRYTDIRSHAEALQETIAVIRKEIGPDFLVGFPAQPSSLPDKLAPTSQHRKRRRPVHK